MDRNDALNILYEAIKTPERAKNDAGEIESRPLDEIVDAVKFIGKIDAGSDPFSAISQGRFARPDVWN